MLDPVGSNEQSWRQAGHVVFLHDGQNKKEKSNVEDWNLGRSRKKINKESEKH